MINLRRKIRWSLVNSEGVDLPLIYDISRKQEQAITSFWKVERTPLWLGGVYLQQHGVSLPSSFTKRPNVLIFIRRDHIYQPCTEPHTSSRLWYSFHTICPRNVSRLRDIGIILTDDHGAVNDRHRSLWLGDIVHLMMQFDNKQVIKIHTAALILGCSNSHVVLAQDAFINKIIKMREEAAT
jgi:hypothetical protein